jgi:hypothetical protein
MWNCTWYMSVRALVHIKYEHQHAVTTSLRKHPQTNTGTFHLHGCSAWLLRDLSRDKNLISWGGEFELTFAS